MMENNSRSLLSETINAFRFPLCILAVFMHTNFADYIDLYSDIQHFKGVFFPSCYLEIDILRFDD
jgi:hypothetical protein